MGWQLGRPTALQWTACPRLHVLPEYHSCDTHQAASGFSSDYSTRISLVSETALAIFGTLIVRMPWLTRILMPSGWMSLGSVKLRT